MNPPPTMRIAAIAALALAIQLLVNQAKLAATAARGQSRGGGRGQFRSRPGVTPCEILRARGYLAEEHYVKTSDGYLLQLTRGTNPLITQRQAGHWRDPASRAPILFVHGIFQNPSEFVVNSLGASPSDLSRFDANQLDIEQLKHRPSAKALPLLAMDFGHEVWILARRGATGSQRRVIGSATIGLEPGECGRARGGKLEALQLSNSSLALQSIKLTREIIESFMSNYTQLTSGFSSLTSADSDSSAESLFVDNLIAQSSAYFASLATLFGYNLTSPEVEFSFDERFWNYSLDEQAERDLPLVVDYILAQTNRSQVALVSHSGGGSVALMALASHPELANKISRAIYWSEALNLGHQDLPVLLALLAPNFQHYLGSFPPAFSSPILQQALGLLCSNPLTRLSLCNPLADLVLGPSNQMEPLRPEFIHATLAPTSSHEIAQLLQSVRLGGAMHKFDFGSVERNLLAYGQREPPIYDVGKIKLKTMTFYAPANDIIVTPRDIQATVELLTVPYKLHPIRAPFNHIGYMWHDDTPELAIIPSLREIQGRPKHLRHGK